MMMLFMIRSLFFSLLFAEIISLMLIFLSFDYCYFHYCFSLRFSSSFSFRFRFHFFLISYDAFIFAADISSSFHAFVYYAIADIDGFRHYFAIDISIFSPMRRFISFSFRFRLLPLIDFLRCFRRFRCHISSLMI